MSHHQDTNLLSLFVRGYELGWFLHQDQDQALKVASNALVALETTAIRQESYTKKTKPRHRTKIQLSTEQSYQYLVLKYSADLQAEELKRNPYLTEDTMLVFFYSFIASKLFRTNSFRANACIARLLLRLPVEETRHLYSRLRPSFRDTDDSEYSREKQNMYGALLELFEGRISPVTLVRNEKSFVPHARSVELQKLAEECWRHFTPWPSRLRSRCPLTELPDDQPQLESILKGESEEVERDRMHIIFHCLRNFAQLILGRAPEMLIPQFVLATPGGDPDGDLGRSLDRRLSPPPLTSSDYRGLTRKLEDARLRRRKTLETLLQCKVDGQVKAEIDLRKEAQSVPITFSAEDDCLEVWANDVLLATYFLPDAETLNEHEQMTQFVEIEGGQQLVCNLAAVVSFAGEVTAFTAQVEYRETSPLRIAARWRQRFKHRIAEYTKLPRLFLAFTLVLGTILFMGDLGLYIAWRHSRESNIVKKSPQVPKTKGEESPLILQPHLTSAYRPRDITQLDTSRKSKEQKPIRSRREPASPSIVERNDTRFNDTRSSEVERGIGLHSLAAPVARDVAHVSERSKSARLSFIEAPDYSLPKFNHVERVIEAELAADGSLTAAVHERSYGKAAEIESFDFRITARPQYDKLIEDWITASAPSAKVLKAEPSDNAQASQFALDVEFESPAYAQSMRGRLLVFKPAIVLRRGSWRFLLSTWQRSEIASLNNDPVVIEAKTYSETVRIKLPLGFEVDEIPDAVELNQPFGNYSLTCEVKDGQLIFKRTLRLKSAKIPVDKRDAVYTFFDHIRAAEKLPVVLEKK